MKHSQDYENASGVIAILWNLDRKYLSWSQNLPPEFALAQVPVDVSANTKDVYGEYYSAYSSIWIAGIWNNYRCGRILANELLRDQVSHLLQWSNPLDPPELEIDHERVSYDTVLATAISTIQNLANDVYCSVPFFLSTTTQDAPRALTGNLVLWPLYLASQTSVATYEMRRWASERLRYIAETIGVRQAGPMAYALMKTLNIEELVDSVAEMSMKEAL
jgi:hypothetical protein